MGVERGALRKEEVEARDGQAVVTSWQPRCGAELKPPQPAFQHMLVGGSDV